MLTLRPKLFSEKKIDELTKHLSTSPVQINQIIELNDNINYLQKQYHFKKHKNKLFANHLLQAHQLTEIFSDSLDRFKNKEFKFYNNSFTLKHRIPYSFAHSSEAKLNKMPFETTVDDMDHLTKIHNAFIDKYLKFRESRIPFPKYEESLTDLKKLDAFSIYKQTSDVFFNFINKYNHLKNDNGGFVYQDHLKEATNEFHTLKNNLLIDSSVKLATVMFLKRMNIKDDKKRIDIYLLLDKFKDRRLLMKKYGRISESDLMNDVQTKDIFQKIFHLTGNKEKASSQLNLFVKNSNKIYVELCKKTSDYGNWYSLYPKL